MKAKPNVMFQIVYLSAAAEKSSESRTVTSIMAKIFTLELAMLFTWKGIQRKDHKVEKSSFKNLALANVVLGKLTHPHP